MSNGAERLLYLTDVRPVIRIGQLPYCRLGDTKPAGEFCFGDKLNSHGGVERKLGGHDGGYSDQVLAFCQPAGDRNLPLLMNISCQSGGESIFCHLQTVVDSTTVRPYSFTMAVTSIKSTYSLDVESVRTLETLAKRWSVSKSEVLRRAIRIAAKEDAPTRNAALDALDRLQSSLRERNVDTTQCASDLKDERRAAGRRIRSR